MLHFYWMVLLSAHALWVGSGWEWEFRDAPSNTNIFAGVKRTVRHRTSPRKPESLLPKNQHTRSQLKSRKSVSPELPSFGFSQELAPLHLLFQLFQVPRMFAAGGCWAYWPHSRQHSLVVSPPQVLSALCKAECADISCRSPHSRRAASLSLCRG